MMVSNICFIAYDGRQLADECYNPVYECISFHNNLTIIVFKIGTSFDIFVTDWAAARTTPN